MSHTPEHNIEKPKNVTDHPHLEGFRQQLNNTSLTEQRRALHEMRGGLSGGTHLAGWTPEQDGLLNRIGHGHVPSREDMSILRGKGKPEASPGARPEPAPEERRDLLNNAINRGNKPSEGAQEGKGGTGKPVEVSYTPGAPLTREQVQQLRAGAVFGNATGKPTTIGTEGFGAGGTGRIGAGFMTNQHIGRDGGGGGGGLPAPSRQLLE